MQDQFQELAKENVRLKLQIEEILDVVWHRRHDQNITIKQLKVILASTPLDLSEASRKQLLDEFGAD